MANSKSNRPDVYTRITDKIIAALEEGTRPWLKPWNAEHAAGRITKPLRHNGVPYAGINIIMLWQAAAASGYSAPIWMTFKQAQELGAAVRKGEHGELVVYANTVKRTAQDKNGDDVEIDIPFMKGYTVFNVEQIDGLPEHYYQLAEPVFDPVQRIDHAESFFTSLGADIRHGGNQAYYAVGGDYVQMPPSKASTMRKATTRRWLMNAHTGPATRSGWIAALAASSGAMKATPGKNWWPSWAAHLSAPTWNSRWSPVKTTPLTSKAG